MFHLKYFQIGVFGGKLCTKKNNMNNCWEAHHGAGPAGLGVQTEKVLLSGQNIVGQKVRKNHVYTDYWLTGLFYHVNHDVREISWNS